MGIDTRRRCPPDLEEESDYAMLVQVKQAIEIMMGERLKPENSETKADADISPKPPPEMEGAQHSGPKR